MSHNPYGGPPGYPPQHGYPPQPGYPPQQQPGYLPQQQYPPTGTFYSLLHFE